MGDGEPDGIGQAILSHLQRDGRRSITDIADALDVSDDTVRNRIRDMEDEEVITGIRSTSTTTQRVTSTTSCSSARCVSATANGLPTKS